MALPPTLLTLQIGNFQITALALCVLAMLAFARARHVPGGIALGLATLSKVFLLSLAAARSPFLPDVYATLASAWLLTLFAAEGGTALRLFGLALMGGACGWLLDAKTLPDPVPIGLLLPTLGIQLTVLALNVWAVARPLQPLAVPALAADATRAETPLQSRLA